LAIIDKETVMEAIPQAVMGIACMALNVAKSWVADMENLHGEGSDQIIADNITQAECNRIQHLIGSGYMGTGGTDLT
jgi:hypothetical protein